MKYYKGLQKRCVTCENWISPHIKKCCDQYEKADNQELFLDIKETWCSFWGECSKISLYLDLYSDDNRTPETLGVFGCVMWECTKS